MSFGPTIAQAIQQYKASVVLCESLGITITPSVIVDELTSFSKDKQGDIFEILHCFLRNTAADIDPLVSEAAEYEIYKAAILLIVKEESHVSEFSWFFRELFNEKLLNKDTQLAIRFNSQPCEVMKAMVMLNDHGVDPRQYAIDFYGCHHPLDRAQAMILLHKDSVLNGINRMIIELFKSAVPVAILLCAFKEDQLLMGNLEAVLDNYSVQSQLQAAAIASLLLQAVKNILSVIMREEVLNYMGIQVNAHPETAEEFVVAKQKVHALEGVDTEDIWDHVSTAVIARMSWIIGKGYYQGECSDLAILVVRQEKGSSLALQPIEGQLMMSPGYDAYFNRVLQQGVKSHNPAAFFKLTDFLFANRDRLRKEFDCRFGLVPWKPKLK